MSLRARLLASEVLVAAGILAVCVFDLTGDALRGPVLANAAGVAVCVVALAMMSWRPTALLLVIMVTSFVVQAGLYGLQYQPPLGTFLVVVAATYFGATRGSTLGSGLIVGAALVTTVVQFGLGAPAGNTVPVAIWLGVTWAIGTAMQHRRRESGELAAQAVRLEADREERARVAVAEERARIARELHDVISHNVSVIVVQASVERRLQGPESAVSGTLDAIEQAGRDTLVELRRLLGVLRKDNQPASLTPQPGLQQVGDLVDQVRAAGIDVTLQSEVRAALPVGVDLAAYRIVQEALTNVIKHANATRVSIVLDGDAERIAVSISDNGRTCASDGSEPGHGLVGMRERVALYDGSFSAGVRVDGGFEVAATLPYGAR